MKASELFKELEIKIPLDLALSSDNVGFMNSNLNPENIDVENVLLMMDYLSPEILTTYDLDYNDYDLLITHHPPNCDVVIPTYVIHSNWDIIQGGVGDALADTLSMQKLEVFDKRTKIGCICKPLTGNMSMDSLENLVKERLDLDYIKVICNPNKEIIETVAIVPGFGLNPKFIKLANDKNADVFISGDLTQPGAILAKNIGINIIDVTHHVAELPGLYRLADLLRESDITVKVLNTHIPWDLK